MEEGEGWSNSKEESDEEGEVGQQFAVNLIRSLMMNKIIYLDEWSAQIEWVLSFFELFEGSLF